MELWVLTRWVSDLAYRILDDLTLNQPSSSSGRGQASPNASSGSSRTVLTPVASQDVWMNAVERECSRRTFWLIHLIELLGLVFTRRKPTHNPWDLAKSVDVLEFENTSLLDHEREALKREGHRDGRMSPRLRLPCCEAEFEMAAFSANTGTSTIIRLVWFSVLVLWCCFLSGVTGLLVASDYSWFS